MIFVHTYSLYRNSIDVEGARALAGCLQHYTNLQVLQLVMCVQTQHIHFVCMSRCAYSVWDWLLARTFRIINLNFVLREMLLVSWVKHPLIQSHHTQCGVTVVLCIRACTWLWVLSHLLQTVIISVYTCSLNRNNASSI